MSSSLQLPYTAYSAILADRFGGKVWKVPVDIGAGCPVRDGRLGRGGCSFCNGRSFAPADWNEPVAAQLERGKARLARKLSKSGRYTFLAYFQNGTNTYPPIEKVDRAIREALAVARVGGVVLATRPDCMTAEWVDYFSELSRQTYVAVELGLESVSDEALRLAGRGHDTEVSRRAVAMLVERQIPVTAHFILGLPGDTEETMMAQTDFLNQTEVTAVKLHQLQIVKGARLAADYLCNPDRFRLWNSTDYVAFLVRYLARLSPAVAIERLVSEAPAAQLIAPKWGLKGDEFSRMLTTYMKEHGLSQGCML